MWSQIRRLKLPQIANARSSMSLNSLGPLYSFQLAAKSDLKLLTSMDIHWNCWGPRSLAMGAMLLKKSKVIAIPVDTSYVFACSAQDNFGLDALRDVIRYNGDSEISVALGNVKFVSDFFHTCDLREYLIRTTLPGLVTYVLRRKGTLNPKLNPGEQKIAVRISKSKFLSNVATLIGPLAMVQAKSKDGQNLTEADDFENLWPLLGGIFYEPITWAATSPVIDLSRGQEFKIVRETADSVRLVKFMCKLGFSQLD